MIEKESSLLVATAEMFTAVFGIDCRTNCEAVSIDAKNKTVDLRNTVTGEVTTESYDKLVLSPGAPSIRPPLPGIDLPGVFEVRTVPDTRAVVEWVEKGTDFLAGMSCYTGIQQAKPTTRAVVVGGGFIGLECAENLVHRGFEVTLIQKPDHVLTPLDPEIGSLVQGHIKRHGVKVVANDGVNGFKQLEGGAIEVQTENGKTFPADVVILAIGVRPETTLAKTAGITIGERGGILVDDQMHTSDPDIFAVGDAIEVKDFMTGEQSLIALAGPANRQGRIAADVICGRDSRYRGTQGTSIIGLFGGAAAWTGVSEKTLKRLGDTDYEKIYLFPNSHAGYYPGAKMIGLKVIFRKSDRKLLGAQALGEDGPGGRQAHQRLRRLPADGSHHRRPRRSGTLLRPAVRQRQGPGELRRHGRRQHPQRLDAGQPLGGRRQRLPARRPQPGGTGARKRARRAQHPAAPAPLASRRTAEGPGNQGHLPLRPARALRHPDPAPARLQRQHDLRRHALAHDEGNRGIEMTEGFLQR